MSIIMEIMGKFTKKTKKTKLSEFDEISSSAQFYLDRGTYKLAFICYSNMLNYVKDQAQCLITVRGLVNSALGFEEYDNNSIDPKHIDTIVTGCRDLGIEDSNKLISVLEKSKTIKYQRKHLQRLLKKLDDPKYVK